MMTTKRFTKEETRAIREHHERLFPGMTAKCRMTVKQMADGIASFKESIERSSDILGLTPDERAERLRKHGF